MGNVPGKQMEEIGDGEESSEALFSSQLKEMDEDELVVRSVKILSIIEVLLSQSRCLGFTS